MALVGDVIAKVRRLIPDPCQFMFPPSIISVAGATVSGGTIPGGGTYYVVITATNQWGETVPSAEFSVSLTSGQNAIIVNFGGPAGNTGNFRFYYGFSAGGETGYTPFSTGTSPFTITSLAGNPGQPPTNSSAMLPDTDGSFASAATMFAWLNDALKSLSRITGGLLDYAGVPTMAGNPLYSLPGEWLSITDVWYSGYWIQGGKRQDFFRRNTVTSQILTGVAVSIFTDKQVIEVSYQPDRNSGVTATTAPMTTTSTSVAITNPGAFLLPFGFAQIGTEMVAYSSLAGGAMSGLIRGVGSSAVAQAWPTGTTVTELPLFFCGKRIFNVCYQPGQSLVTLTVPQGWENILPLYVLAQAREGEQDAQNAERLMKRFEDSGEKWLLSNKGVVKQVQVGEGNRPLIYDSTVAGGIVMPS